MIAILWLKSLFRTTIGRVAATAAGIALAVGLLLVLGIFVVSAGDTMTARAIANVPVDWQIELAPGADQTTVEKALADSGVAKTVQPVGYASVDGFSATTGTTQQVTGAGKVLGLPPGYQTAFPRQIQLLSGSADGPMIFTQTAANLHVGIGDTVAIQRPQVRRNHRHDRGHRRHSQYRLDFPGSGRPAGHVATVAARQCSTPAGCAVA